MVCSQKPSGTRIASEGFAFCSSLADIATSLCGWKAFQTVDSSPNKGRTCRRYGRSVTEHESNVSSVRAKRLQTGIERALGTVAASSTRNETCRRYRRRVVKQDWNVSLVRSTCRRTGLEPVEGTVDPSSTEIEPVEGAVDPSSNRVPNLSRYGRPVVEQGSKLVEGTVDPSSNGVPNLSRYGRPVVERGSELVEIRSTRTPGEFLVCGDDEWSTQRRDRTAHARGTSRFRFPRG